MHDAERILQRLDDIEQKLDILMSAQTDVDNAVSVLNGFLSDVATQITNIEAALTADGTPVDTSALNSVIDQVPQVQAALDALAPAPSSTPPAS
jgi:hypothetical protein